MTGSILHVDRPDRAPAGSTPDVTGWAAVAKGQPLQPLTYAAPDLGRQDVRVAVRHCGLCFTDVQAIEDFYGITAYPFVPGHEIAGLVEAVGADVWDLRVGDRVGIGWQGRSCEQCEWCARGEEQLCRDIADDGTWQHHGGFADSVTVDSRFVYPLPATLSSDVAAVLMCGGASVYTPLRRYAGEARGRVAIFGIGGLGHLAIQFAHALGYEVTAFSTSPTKEPDARAFGADRFVLVGDRSRMRPFDYAFDVALCTAHGSVDWDEVMSVMAKRGRIVVVGFPDVTLDPTDLVAHELVFTGSFIANRATVREMLAFATEHRIEPRLEHLPMARVNEAIARVNANQVRYRMVLDRD
ncbi:MAG TPA: NAD(P)-dependent alcohol dehydrogenase [Candidatus Limnocylindrales bacterium]